MATCGVCVTRPAVSAGATCGDSYCQEAAYYRNLARTLRKGSVLQARAYQSAREAEALAQAKAGR